MSTTFKKQNSSSPGYAIGKTIDIMPQGTTIAYRTKGNQSDIILKTTIVPETASECGLTCSQSDITVQLKVGGSNSVSREDLETAALAMIAVLQDLTPAQLTSVILAEDIFTSGSFVIGA